MIERLLLIFYGIFAGKSVGQILLQVLDILVVAVLIYRLLLILRGTRAIQILVGIGLVFATYMASRYLGLVTLENLFSWLLSSIILLVIVVFQNDIRRTLMRIGSNRLLGGWGHGSEERVFDEVIAATTELARHRTGALIAFERDASLDEFVVGQGIGIDAEVTRELLVATFIPESMNKLHDGAVVLRNLRIAKAGVFFPMPEARNIDAALGSRHRAAIGITEETDSVVIVVSEERGTISLCFNGNLVADLDADMLRKTLLRIFGRHDDARSEKEQRVFHKPKRVSIGTPTPPRTSVVPSSDSPARSATITVHEPAPKSQRSFSKPLAPSATSTPLSPSKSEKP